MNQSLLEIMPAKWSADGFKYLGIIISRSYVQMTNENIVQIIRYIQDCCNKWELLKLSWLGRVVAVNMVLLPKLTFVFLNTVLDIQNKMLAKIQNILNKFIWGGKKPRLKMSLVQKPLQEGITKYYEVALLTACLDWWNWAGSDISLAFEQQNCKVQLADWLFSKVASKWDLVKATPLVKVLGKSWLKYKYYLTPPHFPLQKYTSFPGLDQMEQALNVLNT